MAMLVAEPPVNITSHDEMDATEIMESMYLADEERRQEEAPTILLINPPIPTEGASG